LRKSAGGIEHVDGTGGELAPGRIVDRMKTGRLPHDAGGQFQNIHIADDKRAALVENIAVRQGVDDDFGADTDRVSHGNADQRAGGHRLLPVSRIKATAKN